MLANLSAARAALLALAALLVACVPGATSATESSAVLRATLDNGLRVVVVRNTFAPVVTTEMNYLVGSNEAPAGFPGMAHAQEHMMFRGSPGLSQTQLADITAGLGGDFDADTQQTVTQYFFTVPAEDLEVALHVEAIRMSGVLDAEAAWQRERPAIEQEVAEDLSNPEYKLYQGLLALAFAGTPYALDPLGSRASFDATTGAMLKRFHDRWYAPNNAILVVAGDLDPPSAMAMIRRLFGDIPRRALPPRPAIELRPLAAQTIDGKTDLPYGAAVIAFRLPGYRSPDYAAAEVLGDALSSQRGALYDLVLSGDALSAGFSMSILPDAGLGYATAAFPRGADGRKLLERMRRILEDAVSRGLPEDLVTAAKRAELAQAEFNKNSIPGLAGAWSQALAIEGRDSPQDDIDAIQRVTPEDVDRVARRYLTFDRVLSAVLTPEVSGKPISSQRFGSKESFAAQRVSGVELPQWAQAAVERIAVPAQTRHPESMRLDNGIRLIVQTTSISQTVSVFGSIRNRPSLEVPQGQEGVDEVLDQLFSYGTTSLDRAQFQKALDDIAAGESAGAQFSLQVRSADFERGMQLLADNELHPALPEAAFRVVRQQRAEAVAGELESPGFLSAQALAGALFPKNDPALRHATPKSIAALTLADVRDYRQRVFRPDLTTIVVVGDVTPERAKALVERYFGAWQAQGPPPEVELPPVPPNPPTNTVVPNDSRVQVNVTLAETLALNRYDPDYYALQLGNRMLSGEFYASRLYRDLRESTGLVYYVGSDFQFGRTRALFSVEYGCDPANVFRAREIVERDLRSMQQTAVSPDELHRAVALLLKQIPLSQASVGSVADGLLSRAQLDLPLDEPWRAARHYVTLDPEQVRAAYAKWLRVDGLAQVTEGPAPQ